MFLGKDLVGPLQPFSWPVSEWCVKAMRRITTLPVVNNDPPRFTLVAVTAICQPDGNIRDDQPLGGKSSGRANGDI